MAKRTPAPDPSEVDENPTHPTQSAFFKRLMPLLTTPEGNGVRAHREAQVPPRTMNIDALIDFRDSGLAGGLMKPIEHWCADRLVALEYESGNVSAHKMSNLITKANAARTGRRQGLHRWETVELSRPMTLLLVAENARPGWFVEWGLPVREICRGLWVHEDDLLTTVVVRPYWLGQHPGAHLWGMLAMHIAESTVLRLFGHLLGDPSTASFYKSRAADILQTHYPKSPAMNQRTTEVEPQQKFDATNSRWHQLLEMHLEKERLEAEVQKLRIVANEQRAQTEEQQARAEEQQARAEEQQARAEEQQARAEEQQARAEEQQARAEEQRLTIERLQLELERLKSSTGE